MLNREVKQSFLDACYPGKTVDRCRPFVQLGFFEDAFGKDIAEMTIGEAQRASAGLANAERGTVSNYLGLVKSYVKWCEKGEVFQNWDGGFFAVNVTDIDPSSAISAEFFKNEDEFLASLSDIRDLSIPRNDVFAAVLLWIGVDLADMIHLRPEDFDLESHKVSVNGAEVFWESDAVHRLISRSLEAASGPTVFGSPVLKQTACNWLYRLKSPKFRGENLQRAGGLFRLWCAEQDGIDVLRFENRELMLKIYGIKKQSNRLAWLYEAYKRAFSL